MTACIFLDEGRPGICLLGLFDLPQTFHFCDEDRMDSCPLKTLDGDARRSVLRKRGEAIAKCPHCGRRHGSMYQHLRCHALHQIMALIPEGWSPEGCRDTPFLGIPSPIPERLWPRIRGMVLERDGECCQECGADLSRRPNYLREVHHIIPRIEGGSDHPRNLITLCNECHHRHTESLMRGRMADPKERALRRKFGRGRELFLELMEE
jgi:5-methylcytosine-specific restriction endonuclease McrA